MSDACRLHLKTHSQTRTTLLLHSHLMPTREQDVFIIQDTRRLLFLRFSGILHLTCLLMVVCLRLATCVCAMSTLVVVGTSRVLLFHVITWSE